MELRDPTYAEAVELLHRTHEALVLHVVDGEQAFAALRTGETVMFPVREPVAKHSEVHVRPCAAWLAPEGGSVRVFAHRVPAPQTTSLRADVAAELDARLSSWEGGAEMWEDVLDQVGGWLFELAGDPADAEVELWARRLIEAQVERHAPIGSAPATFDEAVAGAKRALGALGFATEEGDYSKCFGIARWTPPHSFQPWFVSHGTGRMDERDAWLGGIVDRVLRRFGFATVWFGDPRESIEVQGFRPVAQA